MASIGQELYVVNPTYVGMDQSGPPDEVLSSP